MLNKWSLSDKLIKYCNLFICGLLCLIFLGLSVASLISTSILDPKQFSAEHILYKQDSVLLNIVFAAAFFLLLKLLNRYSAIFNLKIMSILLIVYATIIGVGWVVAVQSVPGADSLYIARAAGAFIKGDYSTLKSADSYFRYYPFQLGFTFVTELMMRIFGSKNYVALSIMNVLYLDAVYLALLQITKLIFNNRKIESLMVILLAGCLQPILFCTFIYGNIMGLAFSLWAIIFEMKYIRDNKIQYILASVILISIAIIAKMNYGIVLVAMCIILLLSWLKSKRWLHIAFIAIAVTLALGSNYMIKSSYEASANVKLGGGVPQVLWTAMGLQESSRAPGWYNSYTSSTFRKSNYNGGVAAEQAKMDISKRLGYFSAHPKNALIFFTKKLVSQWNEPTYESIWISKVKEHLSPIPPFVKSIYDGRLGSILDLYFNQYQQIILIGFFAAMLCSLKKTNLLFSFIPLVILGGFLYHMINEAKSQYILIYFVMLVPYSAYGWYNLARLKLVNIREFFQLRKTKRISLDSTDAISVSPGTK